MKKKGWMAVAGVLLAAGIACGGMALKSYYEDKNAGQNYEALREEVTSKSSGDSKKEIKVTATPEPTATATPVPVEIPIDFASLTSQYPDVYAWIQIPGTKIDYPILRREGDNSYYLNHTLEGEERIEGAIFTEDYNKKDFTDPNTVIYGHNMRNGSMFRGLHDYQDPAYLPEHQEVLIYLPDRILHYQIFAAYTYDSRHLLESFDFTDQSVFQGYLDSILGRKEMGSSIDRSVDVTSEDKIITMSTCNGNDDQRYLVQAVLLSIES